MTRTTLALAVLTLLAAACYPEPPDAGRSKRKGPSARPTSGANAQRFVAVVDPTGAADKGPSLADRATKIRAATPEIETFLRSKLEELGLPGMAASVVLAGDPVVSLGLGVRNLENREPVGDDTVFRIGSITKTFAGLALLKLRDDGRLSLDDPVAKYVPEMAQVLYPTQDSPKITIRHLVTHTSGLPRLGKLDYGSNTEPVTERQLLEGLRDLPLVTAPGTHTEYSNLGMAIGGLVVSRASGHDFREYVSRNLLEPLKMGSSWWDQDDVPKDSLATGYRIKDGKYITEPHWRLGAAEALGGLYSSLADMNTYVAHQLAAWPARDDPDPGPIRRATLREGHLIAGHGRPTAQTFGVNWAPVRLPSLGLAVAHTGGTFQYGATVWMLPDRQLAVILMTNTGGESGEAAFKLSDVAVELLRLVRKHDPQADVKLSRPMRRAIEWVHSLLLDQDDEEIGRYFAKSFLDAIPRERLSTVLSETGKALGKCTGHEPVQSLGKHAAVVRMDCAKGAVELTMYLAGEKPHQITGFAVGDVTRKAGAEDDEEEEEEAADGAPAPASGGKAPAPAAAPKSGGKAPAPAPKGPAGDAYD